MKRSILTVAMLFLTTMFVSAQNRPVQGAQKARTSGQTLNLTPAQEVKLILILKAEAPKVQAIKDNTSLSPL
jgi:hypothetical protein